MARDIAIVLCTFLYKLFCLGTGALFGFFGFRLFIEGVAEKSGDLTASWKSAKFVLKSAAPGTFFALVGGAVIAFTLYKGMSFDSTISSRNQPPASAEDVKPQLP